MKKYLFLTKFIFLILIFGWRVNADIVQVGEELLYDVSYIGIKLGTIRILTLPDTNYKNTPVYHSKIFIQSNPNIPFYSLTAIFNSLMDTSLTQGIYFECNSKEHNQEWGFQRITFNKNSIRNEKFYDKQVLNDTTYNNVGKCFDGSTLLFFARKNANKAMNVRLPTIMDLAIGNTFIKFTGRTEQIKIDAFKDSVSCYYLEGKGEWTALYGLGDKFQGWFSADDARVPLKAKMNVYLGNINIELKKWKRKGWITAS